MEEKNKRQEINNVVSHLAGKLLKEAVKYGEKDKEILDAFEYAACMFSAGIRAWAEIYKVDAKFSQKPLQFIELRKLARELAECCIEDAINSIKESK